MAQYEQFISENMNPNENEIEILNSSNSGDEELKDVLNVQPNQIAELIKPKLTTRRNRKLKKLKAPKGKINVKEGLNDKQHIESEIEDEIEEKFEHEVEKFDMTKEKQ